MLLYLALSRFFELLNIKDECLAYIGTGLSNLVYGCTEIDQSLRGEQELVDRV